VPVPILNVAQRDGEGAFVLRLRASSSEYGMSSGSSSASDPNVEYTCSARDLSTSPMDLYDTH
jgi:hypothetical protein